MKTPFQSNAEESSNESHLLIQRSSGYLKIRWDFLRDVLGVAEILCHFSRTEVSIKISKSQQSFKKKYNCPKRVFNHLQRFFESQTNLKYWKVFREFRESKINPHTGGWDPWNRPRKIPVRSPKTGKKSRKDRSNECNQLKFNRKTLWKWPERPVDPWTTQLLYLLVWKLSHVVFCITS